MATTSLQLSQHLRERMIILEQPIPADLGPLVCGPGFVAYQRWLLDHSQAYPPLEALRNYRASYRPDEHGPVSIEIPGRRRDTTQAAHSKKWDDITLVTELLWRGVWDWVAPEDQPGLVVIRPDEGIVLSASPAEARPMMAALFAYPLLSASQLDAASEHIGRAPLSPRPRSAVLSLREKQGLLLEAPPELVDLHSDVTLANRSRGRGRPAAVYLSLPAYVLAMSDLSRRRQWETDPEQAIRRAMAGAGAEVRRHALLAQRLQAEGLGR